MGHETMASGWVASTYARSCACIGPDLALIDTDVVDTITQHSGVNRLQVEDRPDLSHLIEQVVCFV